MRLFSWPLSDGDVGLVDKSNQKNNDELKKDQEVMNKTAKAMAKEAEVARKRKAEEADLQTDLQGKKVDLQEKIAASEAFVRSQENVLPRGAEEEPGAEIL